MESPATYFSSIWIVLVAVAARPGERLEPLILVAQDVEANCQLEIEMPKLHGINCPPYPTGSRCLLVTIDANVLVGCHLALGWPVPERIVDLIIEVRNITNGRHGLPIGGLAGALLWFGRPLTGALGNGTTTEQMRCRLEAVTELFVAMRPSLDWGRALLRGRYMSATANIEATGIPVDQSILGKLKQDWSAVRNRVIDFVDRDFGVYRGRRFDMAAFAAWLDRHEIAWPRVHTGQLDLSNNAFREMARAYPKVRPLKELQTTLYDFDPLALTVGQDGRNRTPLRPFASRTGRNQPSAKASVLGNAAWVRHLIQPRPGTAFALIDWSQQEFGIAAALSGDQAMQLAYKSGDPYLAMAIAAKAAPQDATASSHSQTRDRFKACALGAQYGMGAARLARQLDLAEIQAMELLRSHKATFPRYWSWLDDVEAHALLRQSQQTVLGWRLAVGSDANPRALRNFPMQANGAEMLRLACCLATENCITVCAPIHDALLIEAPIDALDEIIAKARHLMAEASATVLDGFTLRTDVRVVRAPDRWADERGQAVWAAVERTLDGENQPVHQRNATCSSANSRPIS